jgi:anti-sigma factor RsiW
MLAIGASGGYLASSLLMEEEAEYRLTENAIAAHVTYTNDSGHEVEIKADRKDYLMDWLSKRTGLKLVAPDLAAEGFELVGGRILPGEKHAAALLLYEDSAGERMTIYVSAEGADKTWGIREIKAGGPSAVYWLDEGWGCAIVGTLPQERLTELAKNAYRQLKAGAGMV